MSAKNNLKAFKEPALPQRYAGFLSTPLVSRAGYKLLDAVNYFHYDFREKTVLDIGSSTGGFTDLALRLGAKTLIAIEKGSHQMHPRLRTHPRLLLFEKTDFLSVNREDLLPSPPHPSPPRHLSSSLSSPRSPSAPNPPLLPSVSLKIDTILADISFTSLTKIIKCAIIKDWANPNTDFLVMFKPQFELPPDKLHQGIVKNAKTRKLALQNFEIWLKKHHIFIKSKRDNLLPGKTGNLERFYWLKLTPGTKNSFIKSFHH